MAPFKFRSAKSKQLELLQLLIHFNSRVAPVLLHLIHHIHLCLGPVFSQQDPPPMWRLGADDGSCTNHCDLIESVLFWLCAMCGLGYTPNPLGMPHQIAMLIHFG